ncbi:terminase small subunit [Bradyrhizobium sp. HKCCYLS2038]|uniref:terminase small subunit n=1 Tax=Bradyrhizobium sp. HKCCYLS2038 TaxID=3420764 RepID=UPI003EB8C61A
MAKEPKKPNELTPKQAAFVREYLIDLNATQAAVRAGYSPKTAGVISVELMTKPHVKAAIDAAIAERSERTGIDAAWLLNRLADEAEADLADIYSENGALKPVRDWPKIWRQGLVAGVEHIEVKDREGNATGDVIVKIKISDRVKRLELIGKHVGVQAFLEKVEVAGVEALADRIARAKAKAGGK